MSLFGLPRRSLLMGASAAVLAPVLARAFPSQFRAIAFAVFRNGRHIGEHRVTLEPAGGSLKAAIEASMVVTLGFVPVFRYRHRSEELWREGRFETLASATSTNGRREQVNAAAQAAEVHIQTLIGAWTAPPAAAPLSHWNPEVLTRPLFNPETGKLMRLSAQQAPLPGGAGTRWRLRGEADIDDWYDNEGVWQGLTGRLPDKSLVEYRRL